MVYTDLYKLSGSNGLRGKVSHTLLDNKSGCIMVDDGDSAAWPCRQPATAW